MQLGALLNTQKGSATPGGRSPLRFRITFGCNLPLLFAPFPLFPPAVSVYFWVRFKPSSPFLDFSAVRFEWSGLGPISSSLAVSETGPAAKLNRSGFGLVLAVAAYVGKLWPSVLGAIPPFVHSASLAVQSGRKTCPVCRNVFFRRAPLASLADPRATHLDSTDGRTGSAAANCDAMNVLNQVRDAHTRGMKGSLSRTD